MLKVSVAAVGILGKDFHIGQKFPRKISFLSYECEFKTHNENNALKHFAPRAWSRVLVAGLQYRTLLRGPIEIEILAELHSPTPLSGAASAGEEGCLFLMRLPRWGTFSYFTQG